MKARVRAAVVAGLSAAALFVPSTALGEPSTPPAPEPVVTPVADTVRYVALGDSRAAGPGLGAQTAGNCARSDIGYPALVARAVGATTFTNVSCTGARTEHLLRSSQHPGVGPQIDAVTPDTTLVTVSIGGNDIAWPRLVDRCFTSSPDADALCRIDPELEARVAAELVALGPEVTATLAAVRVRAPQARVLLVGHGGLVDNRGCWPNIPASNPDAVWITGFHARMNGVLAGAAAVTGAEYVDVVAGSRGHDACAAPGVRYFEGKQSSSAAWPLHPTAAGMDFIARRVVDTWRSGAR